MRVALFFVCLCYFLSGGYNYNCILAHHSHVCYSSTQYFEKVQQSKFTDTWQDYAEIRGTYPTEDAAYFINDDVEDEDPTNLLTRKSRLQADYNVTLPCPFILSYLYGCSKAPRPFYSFLSYKYITQRVLRI